MFWRAVQFSLKLLVTYMLCTVGVDRIISTSYKNTVIPKAQHIQENQVMKKTNFLPLCSLDPSHEDMFMSTC